MIVKLAGEYLLVVGIFFIIPLVLCNIFKIKKHDFVIEIISIGICCVLLSFGYIQPI
jgi:hypothetical protein